MNNGIQIGKGVHIGGNVTNAVTVNSPVTPDDTTAVLQDLVDAQNKLAEYAPKIADAIGELRKAIEKKDQQTIAQKIAALTSGTAAEIVKGVLGAAGSAAALHFLGWG